MIDRDRWIERCARLYAVLIMLYPRRFRRRFADEMIEAMRCALREEAQREPQGAAWRAWRPIVGELLPTVAGEHAAALLDVVSRRWRVTLAAAPPTLAYVAVLSRATN